MFVPRTRPADFVNSPQDVALMLPCGNNPIAPVISRLSI